ncbi:MAG: FtsQ-type POTRA domain-containing protein [Candidatus Eisenbacteria bacterium]
MRRGAGVKRASPAARARKRAGAGPARREKRALSWRRIAIVSSALLLAGGIGFVSVVAPGWGRDAEAFRIARVDVRGATVLTSHEVEALSGLSEGASLLAVSVPAVEAAIASSPRVERAQASKLLPDRVLIRLVEKEPLALVETAGGVFEVADDLTILPQVERTAFVDVPVVTGGRRDLETGATIDDEELVAALELIRRARDVSVALWMDMSEVRIAPGSGLVIYTVADGAEIRVGSGALDEDGLARLSMVLSDLDARGVAAESIDLRFEDQAVVRVRPGGRV